MEATVSESTSTNGDGERGTRIGLDVETAAAQDPEESQERVEDPDAPRNAEEEIKEQMRLCALCLHNASVYWQEALVIAEHHKIPGSYLKTELLERSDTPELALCFTMNGALPK